MLLSWGLRGAAIWIAGLERNEENGSAFSGNSNVNLFILCQPVKNSQSSIPSCVKGLTETGSECEIGAGYLYTVFSWITFGVFSKV
jgi:hypothetical protein